MYVILCQVPEACSLLAPDCGSWSVVSRGGSMRSEINPHGRDCLPWVADNNCAVSRRIGCK